MNYVYERDHAILVRLNVPAGATGPIPIRAKLNWLACTDKVCVPESGEVALDVQTSGLATSDGRFNEWRGALPRPLGSPARFASAGDRIEVALALPASVPLGEPYIFPADAGVIDYAAPQSFRRDGDTLIASLKARVRRQPGCRAYWRLATGAGFRSLPLRAKSRQGGRAIGGLGTQAILIANAWRAGRRMLLNLMPCVFPILALKALHLARSGEASPPARRDALAYTAGTVVGTGLLGAALLAIRAGGKCGGLGIPAPGPAHHRHPSSPRNGNRAEPASHLPASSAWRREASHRKLRHRCTCRIRCNTLRRAVPRDCAWRRLAPASGGSMLVFAALGLGLALPFVIIAFVPAFRRLLPRPGPWMVRFQRFLAIPMAATAVGCLWLLWRQGGAPALGIGIAAVALLTLVLVWTGWRQRRGAPGGWIAFAAVLATTVAAALLIPSRSAYSSQVPPGAAAWSTAAVAREQAAGRPHSSISLPTGA
jgi:hypothetical protein